MDFFKSYSGGAGKGLSVSTPLKTDPESLNDLDGSPKRGPRLRGSMSPTDSEYVHTNGGSQKGKKARNRSLEKPFIVVFQLLTSISMVLLNKWVIRILKFPMILITAQELATVLIIELLKLLGFFHFDRFSWEKGGKQFVGPSIAFVMPMIFNMLALQHVSVATVVVFRQCSTAMVAVGEYVVMRRRFGKSLTGSILLGIAGSLIYGFSATDYNLVGYLYSFLYSCSVAVGAVYVKIVFDSLPQMSNWEKTHYQNLEGSVPVLVLAVLTEDLGAFWSQVRALEFTGHVLLVLSLVAGFAISVAGVLSRTSLSPTAFTVLANMSKPMTVMISFMLFQAETSRKALMGLSAVLVSGIWYSYASKKK